MGNEQSGESSSKHVGAEAKKKKKKKTSIDSEIVRLQK
jgi:hypothetical protein